MRFGGSRARQDRFSEVIPVITVVPNSTSPPHDKFLAMLPLIRQEARVAFCGVRPDLREELTAEVVANSYCAYSRLANRGKLDAAYATPLAQYAIRQVRMGRQVGTTMNLWDITSPYARLANDIIVERLDQRDDEDHGQWKEALVEDRRAGPAETAAARLDMAAWLRTLPGRRRKIALTLAMGESTGAAAKAFGVSAARISQLRNELHEAWQRFHGEEMSGAVAVAGTV
jgi:hypothetical protein